MEFSEKLQHLRKQNNLTQEQLAKQLYVSRTAISKWESGKGYPSIESLKCISKLFSVSIDELLSSDELINFAKNENRQNMGKVLDLVYGFLDLIVAAFIVLPLFSQKEGDYFLSVSLINYNNTTFPIIAASYAFIVFMAIVGMTELLIQYKDNANLWKITNTFSMFLNALAIIFFIATRQLYIATFMFIFIMIKVVLLLKSAEFNKK